MRTSVNPNVLKELVLSTKAQTALAAYINTLVGVNNSVVTPYGAGALVRSSTSDFTIEIYESEIIVRSYSMTRQKIQDIQNQIKAYLEILAVASVRERMIDVLRRRFPVTLDQTLKNGARAIRITV